MIPFLPKPDWLRWIAYATVFAVIMAACIAVFGSLQIHRNTRELSLNWKKYHKNSEDKARLFASLAFDFGRSDIGEDFEITPQHPPLSHFKNIDAILERLRSNLTAYQALDLNQEEKDATHNLISIIDLHQKNNIEYKFNNTEQNIDSLLSVLKENMLGGLDRSREKVSDFAKKQEFIAKWALFMVPVFSVIGLLAIYSVISLYYIMQKSIKDTLDLKKSKAEQNAILNSAVEAVITINEHGLVESINQATENLFGYTSEELIGQNVSIFMPEPDHSSHNNYIDDYIKGHDPKIIGIGRSVIGRKKDGQQIDVFLSINEIIGSPGHKRRFVGIMRDISARKSAERTLRRSLHSLKTLTETLSSTAATAQEQINFSLDLALNHFNLDIGILSKIEGDVYTVEYCQSRGEAIDPGLVFSLEKTYCHLTVHKGDVVCETEMKASAYANHPCYSQFRLETYIAVPVYVRGELYGTLNFSSARKYQRAFDDTDREFMRLLGLWAGSAMERAQRDEKLLLSEERLKRSQRFANIGNWDLNLTDRTLYWSERVPPLLSGPGVRLEASYVNFLHAIHPSDRQKFINAMETCIEEGTGLDIEHRVIWLDGSVRWLRNRGDVVRNADGDPLNLLGIVIDITRIKEAEEETRRFQRVIENSDSAVLITDLSGSITYANAAFANLFKLYTKNSQTLSLNDILARPTEEAAKDLLFSLEKGISWCNIIKVKNTEDTVFPAKVTAGVVTNESGDSEFNFCLLEDYSDEIHRRSQMQAARDDAEKANRAKSEFLSSMSHELRTPLNAILGFAQLLQFNPKEPLTKAQLSCVNHILKGGEHLLELINGVLDLSRIEAGKIDISLEPINLKKIIEECVEMSQPIAAKHTITLNANICPSCPETVQADHTRLKQVLLNLLSNAIKYNSEEGHVEIKCACEDREMARVTIIDTGNGIPSEKHQELFKPFSRLGAEQTAIEGTGIGLALTQKLVTLMKGHIGFESSVGVGSHFWVDLPKTQKAEHKKAPRHYLNAMTTLPEITGSLLYIEDNPSNIELMEMIMSYIKGLKMTVAHNAELGLSLAETSPPDIILMDINLPGMSGYEALKKLRALDKLAHIPIIALSAHATKHDLEKGLAIGFDHYLAKPVQVDALALAIQEAMASRSSPHTNQQQ